MGRKTASGPSCFSFNKNLIFQVLGNYEAPQRSAAPYISNNLSGGYQHLAHGRLLPNNDILHHKRAEVLRVFQSSLLVGAVYKLHNP